MKSPEKNHSEVASKIGPKKGIAIFAISSTIAAGVASILLLTGKPQIGNEKREDRTSIKDMSAFRKICFDSLEGAEELPITRKELATLIFTDIRPPTPEELSEINRRVAGDHRWQYSDVRFPDVEIYDCSSLTRFSIQVAALYGYMEGQGSCFGKPEVTDCRFNRQNSEGEIDETANSAELLAVICKILDEKKCKNLSSEIDPLIIETGWGGQWFTGVANRLLGELMEIEKEKFLKFLRKYQPGDKIPRKDAYELFKFFALI